MRRKFVYAGLLGMLLLLVKCTQDDTGPIGYNPDASSQYIPVQLVSPSNQDRQQDISLTLIWSEANEDGVTYNVYLDTHDNPDSVIATGLAQSDTTLAVTGLRYATQYYWKVVADFEEASAESFIGNFSTVFPNMDYYNSSNSGLISNRVLSVLLENTGTVWIGTEFFGLQKFDGAGGWRVYDTANSSLGGICITSLANTIDGKKWVGTLINDVYSTSDGNSFSTAHAQKTPNDSILALASDAHGSIFIGARSNGVVRMNNNVWIQFDSLKINGAETNVGKYAASAICIDQQMNSANPLAGIFIGTSNGIYEITDSSITNFYDTTFMAEYREHLYDTVYTGDSVDALDSLYDIILVDNEKVDTSFEVIYSDNESNQHTDTVINSGALTVIENLYTVIEIDTLRFDTVFNVTYTDTLLDIIVDSSIQTYAAILSLMNINEIINVDTLGFDTTYDTSYSAEHYNENSGLSGNEITALQYDGAGNIWVGTASNGLMFYDRSTWKGIATSNSNLTNNNINCIDISSSDKIWAGTNGGGLVKVRRLNDEWVITSYTTLNSSVPSDVINDIAIESFGRVWIATNMGILAFED
ncbi:MAG: hypothetical protein GF401_04215 [Chitinivibrionales bacterium]|nr:hypothetical protein [Chitinivibrionales bacterium]